MSIDDTPAFEIYIPDSHTQIKIWKDGRVEGISEPFTIINRIPAKIMEAKERFIADS